MSIKKIKICIIVLLYTNISFGQKYQLKDGYEAIYLIDDSTLFYSIFKEDTNRIVKVLFKKNQNGAINFEKCFKKNEIQLFKRLYKSDSLGSSKNFYFGNNIDLWNNDIQGVYLYKNNLELGFSYNSSIKYNVLDSNYSFSIKYLDWFYGETFNFYIKDFKGNGNNFFIETEIGSSILLFNVPNLYDLKLFKEIMNKQIFIRDNEIEVLEQITINKIFEK